MSGFQLIKKGGFCTDGGFSLSHFKKEDGSLDTSVTWGTKEQTNSISFTSDKKTNESSLNIQGEEAEKLSSIEMADSHVKITLKDV